MGKSKAGPRNPDSREDFREPSECSEVMADSSIAPVSLKMQLVQKPCEELNSIPAVKRFWEEQEGWLVAGRDVPQPQNLLRDKRFLPIRHLLLMLP